jgi:acyl-CoA dehydrogenase
MYLVSAMLKRYEDQERQIQDLPLLRWSCDQALFSIQTSLDELIGNFPSRPVAWLMRLLVFPLGRRYRPVSDELGHQVASTLLSPSTVRDRLTAGVYINDDTDQTIGRIEHAFQLIVGAETVEKRLAKARRDGQISGRDDAALLIEAIKAGILSSSDAEMLKLAEAARRDVIQVDDFPADYWRHEAPQPHRSQSQSRSDTP